jgi:hypothetical protein
MRAPKRAPKRAPERPPRAVLGATWEIYWGRSGAALWPSLISIFNMKREVAPAGPEYPNKQRPRIGVGGMRTEE